MKFLLDTHAFLWFILNDQRLSATALAAIQAPDHEILISPASCWEIAIKISLGKYHLPQPLDAFFDNQIAHNHLKILPIDVAHAAAVSSLPFHHRDPFDRLLIAQAIVERLPILSADAAFDHYPVTRIW